MRILTIILLLVVSILEAQPLKVMTYNIRYDNAGDGVNQWNSRKDKVMDLLRKYDADIIGVQEALHNQLVDIGNALEDYQFFGVGRDDGKQKGEYSAVFVRKDRFKVRDQNTFWLSETPEVPGSKNWDAAITRVATWLKLTDKKTKREFLLVNTHFDHIGKESRKQSAALLKERAAKLAGKLPVVITGDFNFKRDQPPYEVLMDETKIRLIDTAPKDAPGTACGFAVDARPCAAIDYIFHTPQWNARNYQVITDHDGKYYPSDHLPVIVTLDLPGK
jgi:endonuclease/exonuclease/phosphatase family metal-dependent hydrolase